MQTNHSQENSEKQLIESKSNSQKTSPCHWPIEAPQLLLGKKKWIITKMGCREVSFHIALSISTSTKNQKEKKKKR